MKVSAPSDETLVVSIAEYVKSGLGSPVTSGLGHSMYVETAGGEHYFNASRQVTILPANRFTQASTAQRFLEQPK